MLDLHCHILYGVDDGAPDMDTALEMARVLSEAGFTRVAASPHYGEGPGGDVPLEVAAARRDELNARLRAEKIPLEILPNAEHHVTPELYARVQRKAVVPVGGQGRWLLVEFPWGGVPDPAQVLFHLQVAGYRLLLAHPERYTFLSVDVCEALVGRDVKLQLELGSFVGAYGSRAQDKAVAMLEGGMAHVLATDLHRPKQANNWLAQALKHVRNRYGVAALERGTLHNPEAMLANAPADEVPALLES